MKKLMLLIICFGQMGISNGQNAQIKLYLQQIAANKVYIEFLQKGYQIAKQGLKTIGDLKQAHFTLDGHFFKSLELINPKISRYAKTVGAVILYKAIQQKALDLQSQVNGFDLFNNNEKRYVGKVVANVQTESTIDFQMLEELLTAGQLKMNDAERISRIDGIYSHLTEMYSFFNSFSADVQLLSLQKRKENKDLTNFGKIIDLNP